MVIEIDPKIKVPIYHQIAGSIIQSIKEKKIGMGDKLPSINEIANNYHLSRETVVKGFKLLQRKGIIESLQGKGFYITTENPDTRLHVLLMLDTFSLYKQVSYHAIIETFGSRAKVDTYFHHFNFKHFERVILDNIGNYDYYLICPFDHDRLPRVMDKLPKESSYIFDRYPHNLTNCKNGIYQDFENDIDEVLTQILPKLKNYRHLNLYFRNIITIPPKELVEGFESFCTEHNMPHTTCYECFDFKLEKGDAFIVIDDEDLVNIVLAAKDKKMEIGKDIGIISYNETPLKVIANNGISVISTDFRQMGEDIARMALNQEQGMKRNPCSFIHRGSL